MPFITWIGTFVLNWVLNKVWPLITGAISKLISNLVRKKEQAEAKAPLDQDVKEGAPRDEETKKHEKDWLNS